MSSSPNAYEAVTIPRVEVSLSFGAKQVRARWKEQWINLVADSKEYVVALLDGDGGAVRHATWSNNAFLAHVFLSGLAAEIFASELHDAIARNAPAAELKRIAARHRRIAQTAACLYARQGTLSKLLVGVVELIGIEPTTS
ncbi:MAG TPA: hypothetical protein VJZ76_12715 [Thermoanaerobaculia bacterium]|nr:hypothetical protein [Thermoanaerobaculia bacterium]